MALGSTAPVTAPARRGGPRCHGPWPSRGSGPACAGWWGALRRAAETWGVRGVRRVLHGVSMSAWAVGVAHGRRAELGGGYWWVRGGGAGTCPAVPARPPPLGPGYRHTPPQPAPGLHTTRAARQLGPGTAAARDWMVEAVEPAALVWEGTSVGVAATSLWRALTAWALPSIQSRVAAWQPRGLLVHL